MLSSNACERFSAQRHKEHQKKPFAPLSLCGENYWYSIAYDARRITRMFMKPVSYYTQSGVIPYRVLHTADDGPQRCEVLLITSRKKKHWVIPKGIVETELSPQESALKEAFEEAGVSGVVAERMLGEYSYQKWKGTCIVSVFPLEVTKIFDVWPECAFRERRWMSLEDAVKTIKEPELQEIIERLAKLVLSG